MPIILLALFLLLPFSVQEKKETYLLNPTTLINKQEGTFWCWASVAEGVLSYYGESVPQRQILKEILNIDNILPEYYVADIASLELGDLYKMQRYFRKYNLKVIPRFSFDIPTALTKQEPIVAIFNQHVVIITGLVEKNGEAHYQIIDPNSKEDFTFVNVDDTRYYLQDKSRVSHVPSVFFSVAKADS